MRNVKDFDPNYLNFAIQKTMFDNCAEDPINKAKQIVEFYKTCQNVSNISIDYHKSQEDIKISGGFQSEKAFLGSKILLNIEVKFPAAMTEYFEEQIVSFNYDLYNFKISRKNCRVENRVGVGIFFLKKYQNKKIQKKKPLILK